MDFTCKHYNSVNAEKRSIGMGLDVKIELQHDEKDIQAQLCSRVFGHFMIDNLEDFILEEENAVSSELSAILVGLVYSTLRGILFDRTKGTIFEGLLLPIIAPKALLQIPLAFN